MYSFEDKIEEIEKELEKKRSKWYLDAVPYIDYDDIKQIIMTHIYKKWDKWDQSKSIEPWLSRVVSNQFKNALRNYYGSYVRPCLKCKHNLGGESCSFTKSNTQDSSCVDYKAWELKKKTAYNIKLAVSMEKCTSNLKEELHFDIDYDQATKNLSDQMEKKLNKRQFKVFKMLFIEKKTEEEVANFLGFKTREKKRSAGYKQIKNLKKSFEEKARKILKEGDII